MDVQAAADANRIVKHVDRIAFGFRTPENQRRLLRWACIRQSRRAPSSTRTAAPLLTRMSPDHGESHPTGANATADCE
ncbi:hypothetical protein C6A85_000000115945 [Mycobacterium sp. ITM-2017-0098]|nr:hypothetical protein C6A85_000000115945 [Mycobacterium sp. ITM-2017-0098]